jgi:uncharacterized membrane protein
VRLYDVGIFHQILWGISHGLGFHSTISGAGDFLLDHFSPSLRLLVPAFQYFQETPLFLPALQGFLLFGGAAAWVYLAENVPGVTREFRSQLAGATTLFILGFESLWGNLEWGFHENAVGFFSLSWALALIFTQKIDPSWFVRIANFVKSCGALALLVIAAGSKEILLLDVSLILVCWAYFQFRTQRFPFWMRSLIASIWIGIAGVLIWKFYQFEMIAHPADKNYFNRYYSYLGSDLSEFLRSLVFTPMRVVEVIGAKPLVKYLRIVLAPWFFLPVVFLVVVILKRKKTSPELIRLATIPWGVGILPSFASAALATYPPLREASFHYVLELWPILASVTLLIFSILQSTRLVWLWAIFSLFLWDHNPIHDYREYHREAQQTVEVRAKIQGLPQDAAIVADELAGTWVAGRKWVTRWPEIHLLPNQCPDYILVKHSESGTLTEMGVKALMNRCQSRLKTPQLNSDLYAPIPMWRSGVWSAYRVKVKR